MTLEQHAVSPRESGKPFYFNTSENLLRIGREKANNLQELSKALQQCPADSIFQHTFRTLQEHHFIRQGFSNDFAHWALSACNEPSLAERLAGVDVRDFTSLEDLRQALVSILEDYRRNKPVAGAAHEPFYFCVSDIVILPTAYAPDTLGGFIEGLKQVSVHSIHHHFIEARLRLHLMSNDFSQWLLEEMQLPEAARAVNRIDIYTATMEDVRQRIIQIAGRALAWRKATS